MLAAPIRATLSRAAAGAAVLAVLAAASPGASPPASILVPCDTSALVSDVTSAVSGETLSLAPACTYQLAAGLPAISQTLTFEGNGATLQRSAAQGTPAFVILRAVGGTLTVRSLNFRNGSGAIAIRRTARLVVRGGVFSGNTAAKGAAINDRSKSGGPQITDAVFTDNTSTGFGGAIFDISDGDGVDIRGSTFLGNSAASGGAIYDFAILGDSITGTTFAGNSATACGAFCLFAGTSVSLDRVAATGNIASGSAGGGSVTSNEDVEVRASQFTANSSGALGGGLYLSAVNARVTDSLFRRNSASDGAGLYASSATLILDDVTAAENHADDDGGGVYNDWSGAGGPQAHQARGSRIIANTSGSGGGGIYDAVNATFTVSGGSVVDNLPDNCEPAGSVIGCLG